MLQAPVCKDVMTLAVIFHAKQSGLCKNEAAQPSISAARAKLFISCQSSYMCNSVGEKAQEQGKTGSMHIGYLQTHEDRPEPYLSASRCSEASA